MLLAGAAGIEARESSPLDLVLLVPAGELGAAATRSEIIRGVDEALLAHTSLRAEPIDSALLAETCPEGKFGCFSRRLVRSELYAVISVVSLGEGSLRLAATLIDAKRARACPPNAGEEACIVTTAVIASAPPQIVAAQEVMPRIRAFLLERSRHAFDAAKVWEPYGALSIAFAEEGFEVQLDGETIGSSSKPATRIERVLPGPRKVQLSRGSVSTRAEVVLVERAKTATVAMTLDLDPHPLRTVLLYSGAGAAVAGVVLTTVAIVEAGSRGSIVGCVGANVSCSGRFVGSGDVRDPRPLQPATGPRGVLLAPLGLALAGGGAAWSIGSLLGDEPDPPLFEALIGAGLMIATYAAGAWLGGGAP